MSTPGAAPSRPLAGFPLSAQQRRLWAATESGQAPLAQAVVSLEGPVDPDALRSALALVMARHTALRTSFHPVAGLRFPLQTVAPLAAPIWDETPPACSLNPEELAREERRQAATAGAGAAVRARSISGGPGRHVLVLTLPALCADLETMKIVFAEMTAAYGQLVGAGGEFSPGEAELQQLQLFDWQEGLIVAEEGEAGRRYWQERSERAGSQAVKFAFEGRGSSGQPSLPGGTFHRRVGAHALQGLRDRASQAGVSVEAWLLAAWQEVLFRFSEGAGVATWVTLPGRFDGALDALCGALATTVPLISGERDLDRSRRAAHVQEDLAQAGQMLPYFRPDRDPEQACSELRVGFRYLERPSPRKQGGVTFSLEDLYIDPGPARLELCCLVCPEQLVIRASYQSCTAEEPYIHALVDAMASALGAGPQQAATPLPAADPGSTPSVRTSPVPTLHRLFEIQAARTPSRTAASCHRRSFSFAQLNAWANRIAHTLVAMGVGPETPVGLFLDRSSQVLAAILGVLKAGGAYVPLSPAHPSGRVRGILADTGARVVLTETSLAASSALAGLVTVCLDGPDDVLSSVESNCDTRSSADNLAYVIYTSGSSGAPKGVEVSHRSVVNLLQALRGLVYAPLGGPCQVSLNAPTVFDASVKQWIQVLDGHTLHVVPEEARLDPEALWRFARERRLDVLDCTPSQLKALVDCEAWTRSTERGLRAVLVGGESIDDELWTTLAGWNATTFFNVYGPTECTVDATAARVAGPLSNIGVDIEGCQTYVLDGSLSPQPLGAPGEVFIGGAGVARGYRGQPGLSAERFLVDPFSTVPGSRMYRTGDRACRLASGALRYLGRLDNQVKLRGNRIELDEIASALRGSPEVRDALALVRGGAGGRDSGEALLVAYVVPRPGIKINRERLRAHLRLRLPDYMVPGAFVVLERFPLTTNGKLDVATLPAADPHPGQGEGGEPGGTPTQQTVAAIWREVLDLPTVGFEENFFDVGGHSLRMVKVHARLRAALGRDVPMVELFRNPTISALARYLDGREATAAPALAASSRAHQRIAAARSARNRKGREEDHE